MALTDSRIVIIFMSFSCCNGRVARERIERGFCSDRAKTVSRQNTKKSNKGAPSKPENI